MLVTRMGWTEREHVRATEQAVGALVSPTCADATTLARLRNPYPTGDHRFNCNND
jgi:hypothetical protein